MNQITALLVKAANNKHTSLAALIYGGIKIAAIWLPKYKAQLEATEAIAVAYGLFMAGDAGVNVAGQLPIKPTPPADPPTTIVPPKS